MFYFHFLYFLDNQTQKNKEKEMRVEDIYDGLVGMSGGNGGFDGGIEGFFNGLLVDLSLGFSFCCCLRWVVSLASSSISPRRAHLSDLNLTFARWCTIQCPSLVVEREIQRK